MDRTFGWDVGFGKTEVAMRAALRQSRSQTGGCSSSNDGFSTTTLYEF